MSFWVRFQRKIVNKKTSEEALKSALLASVLASVLSSDSRSMQRRKITSLSQFPIDPRQDAYGEKFNASINA
jgi:hypothetical protein